MTYLCADIELCMPEQSCQVCGHEHTYHADMVTFAYGHSPMHTSDGYRHKADVHFCTDRHAADRHPGTAIPSTLRCTAARTGCKMNFDAVGLATCDKNAHPAGISATLFDGLLNDITHILLQSISPADIEPLMHCSCGSCATAYSSCLLWDVRN